LLFVRKFEYIYSKTLSRLWRSNFAFELILFYGCLPTQKISSSYEKKNVPDRIQLFRSNNKQAWNYLLFIPIVVSIKSLNRFTCCSRSLLISVFSIFVETYCSNRSSFLVSYRSTETIFSRQSHLRARDVNLYVIDDNNNKKASAKRNGAKNIGHRNIFVIVLLRILR
jgi:hypothetical protein